MLPFHLEEDTVPHLAERALDSHKGCFGSLAVMGGARGYVGAALLAARTALKLGAGRVTVGLLEPSVVVDPSQPELMFNDMESVFEVPHLDTFVVGPGLGQSQKALWCLEQAIQQPHPLVLDADALNLLGQSPHLKEAVKQRIAPTLLTPHPAEAARLLGVEVTAIQKDRPSALKILTETFQAYVVLKGRHSLCGFPDGRYAVNTSGNPALASAGTGDVLSGLLGAFLAQKMSPEDALCLGVYLHGKAADFCVEQGLGPVGLAASELIEPARILLNRHFLGHHAFSSLTSRAA